MLGQESETVADLDCECAVPSEGLRNGSAIDAVKLFRLNAETIVIDHDILGWGEGHREALLKEYRKIVKVGTEHGLERRKSDTDVATYCKENKCDLVTGDRTAYEHFFAIGVKKIQMARYDWFTKGDKAVYLIQIVE